MPDWKQYQEKTEEKCFSIHFLKENAKGKNAHLIINATKLNGKKYISVFFHEDPFKEME